ncbi:hypothetical protein [Blastopirellula marina]|nr:hypothetical protein [Blastopirellula marina]
MKRNQLTAFATLLLAVVSVTLVGGGCSPSKNFPELKEVSGVLIANGQPAPEVSVVFYPQGEGGASRGTTDLEGKFQLMYDRSTKGAVLGAHRVKFLEMSVDESKSRIPRKYTRTDNGLTVEVTSDGPNEFVFDLKGK